MTQLPGLARALKKDSEERYASIEAFANALGKACGVTVEQPTSLSRAIT